LRRSGLAEARQGQEVEAVSACFFSGAVVADDSVTMIGYGEHCADGYGLSAVMTPNKNPHYYSLTLVIWVNIKLSR